MSYERIIFEVRAKRVRVDDNIGVGMSMDKHEIIHDFGLICRSNVPVDDYDRRGEDISLYYRGLR